MDSLAFSSSGIMRLAISARRFILTGVLATLMHSVITIALVDLAHLHPSVANGLAYLAANIMSYVVNTRWSFQSHYSFPTWLRFILVSLLVGLLTVTIAWFVDWIGGHYLVGLGIIVTVVPMISFIAHRFFTYPLVSGSAGLP